MERAASSQCRYVACIATWCSGARGKKGQGGGQEIARKHKCEMCFPKHRHKYEQFTRTNTTRYVGVRTRTRYSSIIASVLFGPFSFSLRGPLTVVPSNGSYVIKAPSDQPATEGCPTAIAAAAAAAAACLIGEWVEHLLHSFHLDFVKIIPTNLNVNIRTVYLLL